ncbi:MAG TPA: hypothetical protein VFG23_24140, partial [Polyangia bacterium]|nr:hypothetical protein [Polyangia bacterium]
VLTPACAMTSPLQNGSAATTAGGIAMVVERQSCDETVQPRQPGNDLVEAIVELEVRNPTDQPVAVHRDRLRLTAPDGSSIRTSTWFANHPLTIAAAQRQTFQVRFMSRGGLSCWKPMELRADGAVTRGAEPLTLAAVRFTPAHAPPGYGTPSGP